MPKMQALRYDDTEQGLHLSCDQEQPIPKSGEALIRILRAGICSTDLEIIKGYVPGYKSSLGHEFVGVVESCDDSKWQGQKVVGEINCLCEAYQHSDPVMVRNHAPNRVVLGIINKDGCMAEYITLPMENLHLVPSDLSDQEACFAEPLAAACRIAEQQVIHTSDKVAVIGDGKLGLLVAQALVVLKEVKQLTHFGRHQEKLRLVNGTNQVVVNDETKTEHSQAFDVVIDATGSSQGILLALAMACCMGTIVLKSTCSLKDPEQPQWSAIANDLVVNEKRLVGSRCGPFQPALQVLQDPRMRRLVNSMVTRAMPLSKGLEAIKLAQSKGALKVQLVM